MDLLQRMLKDVETFNKDVIGLPVAEPPTRLTGERFKHAYDHLEEELHEFLDAKTKEDQLDALVDLIYVALGRIIEIGVTPGAAFDIVHKANMAKHSGKVASRPNSQGFDAVKPEDWEAPTFKTLLNMSLSDVILLDNLPAVFKEVTRVRIAKGEDYNAGPELIDYFPFDHKSYAQMVHLKNTRILSLLAVMDAGKQPNFEGLRDTLIDLINYASFYVEFLDVNNTDEEEHH